MKKKIALSFLIITIAIITIYSVTSNNKETFDENSLIVDYIIDKTWEWSDYEYTEYPLHIEINDKRQVRITAVVKRDEYSYSEITKISKKSMKKIKSLFKNYDGFGTYVKARNPGYDVYDIRLKIKLDGKWKEFGGMNYEDLNTGPLPKVIHEILTEEYENEVKKNARNGYREIFMKEYNSKYKDSTFNSDSAFIEYSYQPSYIRGTDPRYYKQIITVNEENEVRFLLSSSGGTEYYIVEEISEETKNKLKELVNGYTQEEIEKKRGDEKYFAENNLNPRIAFGSADAPWVHLRIKQNDTWYDMGGYACTDAELGPIMPELDKIITQEIIDDVMEMIRLKYDME